MTSPARSSGSCTSTGLPTVTGVPTMSRQMAVQRTYTVSDMLDGTPDRVGIVLRRHAVSVELLLRGDGAADGVPDDGTGLINREHVARFQAVGIAAVQHHDLMLADLGHAVDDRNDLAVDAHARRVRNEHGDLVELLRQQAVAF